MDTHEHLRTMAARVPFELVRFGSALADAEFMNDGWAYFLEKPWKWSAEYALWINAGRPSEGDGHTWDVWCDQLVELESPA